jgi:hypothetical protein
LCAFGKAILAKVVFFFSEKPVQDDLTFFSPLEWVGWVLLLCSVCEIINYRFVSRLDRGRSYLTLLLASSLDVLVIIGSVVTMIKFSGNKAAFLQTPITAFVNYYLIFAGCAAKNLAMTFFIQRRL